MEPPARTKRAPSEERPRAGLTRRGIVSRALEIGNAEGLDAVTLRRLASELGVTPMALYRHFRDKQDLVNAMTEVILEDFDVMSGISPEMTWVDQIRHALRNYKAQMDARPLALPLSIAYDGEGSVSFWRILEDLLAILLGAGFERRQAIVLMRVLSNLLAGYLLLLRQGAPPESLANDARKIDVFRRQFEIVLLSLPGGAFPLLTENAGDLADVWLSDPDRWWRDTSELIVLGLEGLLARTTRP
jgi:AcrR family transcriptional regulator